LALGIAIRKLFITIEGVSIAVEGVSVGVEEISIGTEGCSVVGERRSFAVEASSRSNEWLSFASEKCSIAIEKSSSPSKGNDILGESTGRYPKGCQKVAGGRIPICREKTPGTDRSRIRTLKGASLCDPFRVKNTIAF
jgi:hypothetical protein